MKPWKVLLGAGAVLCLLTCPLLLTCTVLAEDGAKVDPRGSSRESTVQDPALQTNRQQAEKHYLLGQSDYDAGKYAEAVREFQEAVLLAPDYVQAYNALGVCYDQRKEFDKAFTAYQQAVSIDPSAHYVYNNIGSSHLLQGRYQEAFNAFSKAVAMDPGNKLYLANLQKVSALLGTSAPARPVSGSPPSGAVTAAIPSPDQVSEGSSPTCTYSISPGGQSFSSSADSGAIAVSTQNNCQWTASSSVAWVTITSTNKGSGSGTIRFSLSVNPGTASRTAQIIVGGQRFPIMQDGTPRQGGTSRQDGTSRQGGTPEITQYSLTVRKTGSGQGAVTTSPAGTLFQKGTSVTLNAVPSAGSSFSGWSGACSGTAQTCSIRVNSSASVTASFSSKTLTISVSPPSNGIIYPPGPVKAEYGEKRTFQIIPLPGYRVSDVLIDRASVGAVNTYTFKGIVADHVIQATFVKE
jgi:hypothetical protein